jgi:hypothetical protein
MPADSGKYAKIMRLKDVFSFLSQYTQASAQVLCAWSYGWKAIASAKARYICSCSLCTSKAGTRQNRREGSTKEPGL